MSVGDLINITVDESKQIFIGRAPDVDVSVRAPSVGRRVVALWLETEGVMVGDLGSGSGSALEINGVRTQRPHGPLPDGAGLWIGRVGFRVELVTAPEHTQRGCR
jgi:pSer/pThr/pTyr-binding forkhead associated (FHA) protein